MTTLVAFSLDEAAWDGPESVTYQSSTRAGGPVDVIPVAKRRAILGAEKSPSGGVYVGSELTWWFAAFRFLPMGLTPKEGDVVIDQDGGRWTALRVQKGKQGNSYKIDCVNLALALQLRDLVDIEKPRLTYDSAGALVKAFPSGAPPLGGAVLYRDLPARVQLLTEEVVSERGLVGLKGSFAVTVDRQLDVTGDFSENRVRWDDAGTVRYLEIKGYHNPRRLDELPVLDCELAI